MPTTHRAHVIHDSDKLVAATVDLLKLAQLYGAVDLGVVHVSAVDLVAEPFKMHHQVLGGSVQCQFFLGQFMVFAFITVPSIVFRELLRYAKRLQKVWNGKFVYWRHWVTLYLSQFELSVETVDDNCDRGN